MSDATKNDKRKFIGKVKLINGQNGSFSKILIDNPFNTDKDGQPNKYYKGSLVWVDASGQQFVLKALSMGNISERDASNGFTHSVSFVIDSDYEVVKS